MVIYNALIRTMNPTDDVFNGWVEVSDGKITVVSHGIAPDTAIEGDSINARGGTLFPGFIDAHTHMGLFSSGIGVEGEDFNEDTDPVTPQLNVLDAINPMDISFKDALGAGVTTVAVSPGSTNTIAGKICAIKTSGVRADKMLVREIGMKFALGENPKMAYLNKGDTPCTRMATASLIKEALTKAKRYLSDLEKASDDSELSEPEYDAKCEALIPLLKREVKAHFHCHRADDIFTAVRIANEFELDYVLIHCTEGHLIAEELATEGASVVVGPIISDRSKPELANISPTNSAVLRSEGIEVAICTDHSEVPIQYLPISVGIAMKYGLSFDDALRAVTSSPAKICGIFDRTGSIEVGKDADLVLFPAGQNPFEINSSPICTICDGVVFKA